MSNKFINTITKVIVVIAIILGIIFIAAIFFSSKDAASQTQKNEEQIRYLDTKLLSLINYLNNIELQNYKVTLTKVEAKNNSAGSSSKEEEKGSGQEANSNDGTNINKEETEISKMEEDTVVTNEGKTDWETIEGELELLYSTWPTIVLDLYNINVNSEDILAFSDDLNETILNVKKKDKALSAMYIAKLYSYLPKFLDNNAQDEIRKEALEAKAYIINAYAYAETKNFDKMGTEIAKAENIFTSLVNDARFVNDQRKYNINKSYILIEELKNSLSTKDTGIFYVKYKNTLEELNIIS